MTDIVKRDSIDEKYKWKTENIYKSDEEWENAFESAKILPSLLNKFKGRLTSPIPISDFLSRYFATITIIEKLYIYAHLKNDEDTSVSLYKSMKSRCLNLDSEFSTETSFFEPEFIALSDDLIEELLKFNVLDPYRHHLERIIRSKSHILSEKEEIILSSLSTSLSVSSEVYVTFTDTDLKYPSFTHNSEEHALTDGKYSEYIINQDREFRSKAFNGLFSSYKKWENTLSTTLHGKIKTTVNKSKIRKYDSSLDASLFPNEIDTSVYRNLIEAVKSKLWIHHRYLSLRKKILNVDVMEYYDLYVPLVRDVDKKYSVEEAVKLLYQCIEPLGAEYRGELKNGIESGWIDWFENDSKTSGAYSSGGYDTQPYILMNYNGTLNNVFTLVHEAGHSMHSLLSNKHQSSVYNNYPTFLAEIASIFNEHLLSHLLLERTNDKNERLFLINNDLESIRTKLIRQTMFAEFELKIHEEVEKGNPLTTDSINEIYREILKTYFADYVNETEGIVSEWARIPHFYYNFYVYQYSTGAAASMSLANKVLNGGEVDRLEYLNFLKSGDSDTPISILKKAGVDMTTAKPINDTMDHMDKMLDQLEQLI